MHMVHDAPRDLMRHERVAIAIPSHPGAKRDELAVDGQSRLSNAVQSVVNGHVVLRHRIPQRLLDHAQPIAGLVLRGGLVGAHVIGAPDGKEVLLHIRERLLTLKRRRKVPTHVEL